MVYMCVCRGYGEEGEDGGGGGGGEPSPIKFSGDTYTYRILFPLQLIYKIKICKLLLTNHIIFFHMWIEWHNQLSNTLYLITTHLFHIYFYVNNKQIISQIHFSQLLYLIWDLLFYINKQNITWAACAYDCYSLRLVQILYASTAYKFMVNVQKCMNKTCMYM